MKGAAIATVISQTVSAIYVVLFLSSKKSGLRLDYSKFGRINIKTLFAIMALVLRWRVILRIFIFLGSWLRMM